MPLAPPPAPRAATATATATARGGSAATSSGAGPGSLHGCAVADAAAEVYLNTHEPFCLAAVGMQGGGKSHTMACVLESCLVPFPEHGVVRLRQPMATLVLH